MSDTGMPIALLTWKPLQRNTLKGFAKVRIGRSLIVSDVAVHNSSGRRWAQLPAKPLLTADGTVKKNDKGKTEYVPVLEWADRDSADRFSASVIGAVERENPGATE